nr:MAG TPA: hypothetical protein [Siphoviridae sp. ctFjF5]
MKYGLLNFDLSIKYLLLCNILYCVDFLIIRCV